LARGPLFTLGDPRFSPSRSEHGLSDFFAVLSAPTGSNPYHATNLSTLACLEREQRPRQSAQAIQVLPATLDALRIQACPDQRQVWPRYSSPRIAIRTQARWHWQRPFGEILLRRPYVRSWPRPPKSSCLPSILAPRADVPHTRLRAIVATPSGSTEGQASPRRQRHNFIVRDPLRVSGPAKATPIVADHRTYAVAAFRTRWIHSSLRWLRKAHVHCGRWFRLNKAGPRSLTKSHRCEFGCIVPS